MKHIYFILAFVSANMFGQPKTYTVSLYYDINQVKPIDDFKKVDSMYSSWSNNKYAVKIIGYADFLHSDAYNFTLSKKRADAVREYLLKKAGSANVSIENVLGVGEKQSTASDSKDGEPQQRRVDICVTEESFKKIGTRQNIVQVDTGSKKTESKTKEKKLVHSSSEKKIEELEKGESLTIEGLNFIPGRHIPVKSALPVLDKLLKTMKEHPNLKIEIQGHICCIYEGDDGFDYDTHDMKLSRNRAMAVYNYLVKNGIDKDRMTYKGYGRTQPKIEIERSEEDEQANRRVDIRVLEN
ncbi:MAG: OmpA family protein [Bacteroidia bacterium]|nr:OmpA family protein [Bacteroidia bacterium]